MTYRVDAFSFAGAQVSVMARIALWARLRDLSLGDVERALVNERTIVKTWSMRGALHLHRSSDLSVILGGLLSRRLPLEQRWIRRDQGWLAPVALFDGRVAGTWTYQRKSNTLHIAVQMFTPFGREIRRWKKKQATCRVSSKLLT